MLTRRLLLISLVGAAAACSSQRPLLAVVLDGVTFRTAKSTFTPGEDVVLALSNGSPHPLGYNLCFLFVELERYTRGWTAVSIKRGPDPITGVYIQCDAMMYGIEPGGTATGRWPLPDTLTAGTYRLATRLWVRPEGEESEPSRAATAPFVVQDDSRR